MSKRGDPNGGGRDSGEFDEDAYLQWWEETWGERQAEVERVYGASHPPGSPEGYVIAFDWDDVSIPGGCCLVFPPRELSEPWHRDWIYASLGLTQPGSPDEVRVPPRGADEGENDEGDEAAADRAGHRAELGLVLVEPAGWAANVLRQLMWYVRAEMPIGAGDRMPFGAERTPGGSIDANIGDQAGDGVPLVGEMRALLFWPYLAARSTFTTATGSFSLLVGTAITAGEWELAKRLSSEHLLVLLHRAGVGQRSDLDRRCLTTDAAAAEHLRAVESMSREAAEAEVERLRRHHP